MTRTTVLLGFLVLLLVVIVQYAGMMNSKSLRIISLQRGTISNQQRIITKLTGGKDTAPESQPPSQSW